MVSEAEFAWIEQQAEGDYDHLLVGTSLPWLLPRALHDVESWDERVAAGSRGARIARWAEKIRRAADLEHWASMRESFDRLADLFGDVGRGRYSREHGRAPATICVLSGDVHHAYVAAARYPHPMDSRVYQLTCSPMHNYVPSRHETGLSTVLERARGTGGSLRIGTVRHDATDENLVGKVSGPYFGNQIATLQLTGRAGKLAIESATGAERSHFTTVAEIVLGGADGTRTT